MKRMLAAVLVVVVVVLFFVGQQVWAAMMRRPPLTTHLQLAALRILPWTRMSTPSSVDVVLPWGFRDRGQADARTTSARVHLPFGFGDYRTQHPLGGGTTHRPLQVDVIVVRDDVDSLRGWFFNAAGFVAIGGGRADSEELLPDGVVIEHYDRIDGPSALRAVVIVDVGRKLRLEVVDELQRLDQAQLREFALKVFAAIVINGAPPAT